MSSLQVIQNGPSLTSPMLFFRVPAKMPRILSTGLFSNGPPSHRLYLYPLQTTIMRTWRLVSKGVITEMGTRLRAEVEYWPILSCPRTEGFTMMRMRNGPLAQFRVHMIWRLQHCMKLGTLLGLDIARLKMLLCFQLLILVWSRIWTMMIFKGSGFFIVHKCWKGCPKNKRCPFVYSNGSPLFTNWIKSGVMCWILSYELILLIRWNFKVIYIYIYISVANCNNNNEVKLYT